MMLWIYEIHVIRRLQYVIVHHFDWHITTEHLACIDLRLFATHHIITLAMHQMHGTLRQIRNRGTKYQFIGILIFVRNFTNEHLNCVTVVR